MIIRGTTQMQLFAIPFDWYEVVKLYVTYSQAGEVVLEKTIGEMTYIPEQECVAVPLSQEDTLSFNKIGVTPTPAQSMIYIQLRALMSDGRVYASIPLKERVYDSLKDGVIEL